ncbi:MAG: condensation domain-containing protein, partial [Burkholderiales bacterium]
MIAEQGPVSGVVALTPIQQWLFATNPDYPQHFDQSMVVELPHDLEEDALRTALGAVIDHHDALRMRFTHTGGYWRQDNTPPTPVDVLQRCDVSEVDPGERAGVMRRVMGEVRAGFDLGQPPLVRAVLFDVGGGQRPVLFVVVHHLVVDAVSWRILLEDLETAYQQTRTRDPITLALKTTSFQHWATRLRDHATAGGFTDELGYWLGSHDTLVPLPTDGHGPNTYASTRSVTVRLTAEQTTALLHDVPGVYRTQINDILLTAVAHALSHWTRDPHVHLHVEGHGREDLFTAVDLSRTVGWFTTLFPLTLTLTTPHDPPSALPGASLPGASLPGASLPGASLPGASLPGALPADLGGLLKSVKEQLRAIPRRGLGYGALRYLTAHTALADQPTPQISFNYLGRLDPTPTALTTFSPALEGGLEGGLGGDAHPDAPRAHLLDVVGRVAHHCLELTWTYSHHLHHPDTITTLAHHTLTTLHEIINHCTAPEAGGATPSDFPLTHLDQATLDHLTGNAHHIDDIYPLTPMQAGMVFHTVADTASGAYHDQVCLRLSGVSDPHALGVAWQRVVDRTPVLRSSMVWDATGVTEPLQIVHRHVTVPVTHQDWRGLAEGEITHRQHQLVATDRAAGMDLGVAPLLRVTIARLAEDEALLVWAFHHVVLDGWSLAQVLGEVCEQYAASVTNRRPELVARRPFRDYLQWLSTQDHDQAQEYWQRVLSGVTSPTPLPYDRTPLQAHHTESSRNVSVTLTEDESTRVRAFAQHHGLTVNTVIQGTWALVLSRFSAVHDVMFGTTVSGRPPELSGVESMVGLFINTIPTRVTIRDDHTVVPWLRELQTTQI